MADQQKNSTQAATQQAKQATTLKKQSWLTSVWLKFRDATQSAAISLAASGAVKTVWDWYKEKRG